ncbi:sigma 54-interacting transcriptional regulator [Bacillus sp. 7884-1]|nr:sigma 54-interacting transcriptional regulator [Bacillus sp. 7884-1]
MAKSFKGVNCEAIPESLFESELFGYDDVALTELVTHALLIRFSIC